MSSRTSSWRVGCVTAPPALVLQTEEGSPTGTNTSREGFCVGDVVIRTTGTGTFQVLATGGDAALGGDDFDHALAEHLLSARGIGEGTLSAGAVKSVLAAARAAKEDLTASDSVTVELSLDSETTS